MPLHIYINICTYIGIYIYSITIPQRVHVSIQYILGPSSSYMGTPFGLKYTLYTYRTLLCVICIMKRAFWIVIGGRGILFQSKLRSSRCRAACCLCNTRLGVFPLVCPKRNRTCRNWRPPAVWTALVRSSRTPIFGELLKKVDARYGNTQVITK